MTIEMSIHSVVTLNLIFQHGNKAMSSKDSEIKMEIEEILQNNFSGMLLKSYFENISKNKIRRTIHILAAIYPNKIIISDDDFVFISYMLSNEKFLKQENYFEFIRSLNIINFTENQKNTLINLIKENIEILCEACTFELDYFLIKIFNKSDLFKYMETLTRGGNSTAVLRCISDILRYEDFSNINISDEALEKLDAVITAALRTDFNQKAQKKRNNHMNQ
jgi:hypothetical protein